MFNSVMDEEGVEDGLVLTPDGVPAAEGSAYLSPGQAGASIRRRRVNGRGNASARRREAESEGETSGSDHSDSDGDGERPSRRQGGPTGFILEYLEKVTHTKLMDPNNVQTVNFMRKLNAYVIDPPDPIATKDVKDPAAIYYPRLYICSPFDVDSSYAPFCPSCRATGIYNRGWSGFRRVLGLDATHYAVTRHYSCKSYSTEFLGWDEAIVQSAPEHIIFTFPVKLPHKRAVTETMIDLMRSCLDAGTGTGGFTNIVAEQHKRRHHRMHLAYLPRIHALRRTPGTGQISMHAVELSAETPPFSSYEDATGYAGSTISKNFLRHIYAHCVAVLQTLNRLRHSMIKARALSGDHFFKILLCNLTFTGQRSFEAAYSFVHEHSEVMAIVLSHSKGLEEMRTMLAGVAARMRALGLPKEQLAIFLLRRTGRGAGIPSQRVSHLAAGPLVGPFVEQLGLPEGPHRLDPVGCEPVHE